MTLTDRIAKLRELEAKATKGPWRFELDDLRGPDGCGCILQGNDFGYGIFGSDNDGALVVALRNDALDIIDEQAREIVRLEGELAELSGILESIERFDRQHKT